MCCSSVLRCVLQAFKEQELPGDIAKRIKQQEQKICQQQVELEELRSDTKKAQEEWQKQREREQAMAFKKQKEELERLKDRLKEMEMQREASPAVAATQQQQQQVCTSLSLCRTRITYLL